MEVSRCVTSSLEPSDNMEEELEVPVTSLPPLATTEHLATEDKLELHECVETLSVEELSITEELEGIGKLLDPICAEGHLLPQHRCP